MRPAHAMGTFLKVWRSEWAGLSRAQLAIGVSACVTNGRRVKPGVVQWWEEGQPPGTTEELEALLTVMQRHGLQPREALQFRRAVFAACVDRQYPEFFEGEDFGYQRDVDEAAHTLFERHWTPGGADLVQLVALADSVARAIRDTPSARAPAGQARRQAVALCYLRALIADAHDYGSRPEAAATAWAENREALQGHLGRGGLGWPLTPLYGRVREAYSRSYPGTESSYPKGFGSPVWSVRLLELAEQAEEEGDLRVSVQAFFHALGGLDHYRHRDLPTALSQAPEYLAKAEAAAHAGVIRQAHVELCITHARLGHVEEAEKHLTATEYMRSGSPLHQAMWYCNLGRLRLAQGDHSAAQDALELAQRAAQRAEEKANWEDLILGFLNRCEREELSARHRTLHPVVPPNRTPRPRGRAAAPKRQPPTP